VVARVDSGVSRDRAELSDLGVDDLAVLNDIAVVAIALSITDVLAPTSV
jgi:hypothetical protein